MEEADKVLDYVLLSVPGAKFFYGEDTEFYCHGSLFIQQKADSALFN